MNSQNSTSTSIPTPLKRWACGGARTCLALAANELSAWTAVISIWIAPSLRSYEKWLWRTWSTVVAGDDDVRVGSSLKNIDRCISVFV